MNTLLQRQIIECLGKIPGELPGDYIHLLNVVSQSYNQFEEAKLEQQTFLQNMQGAFFSVDATTRKTLQISGSAEVIWGYKAEDFMANPDLWLDLVLDEDKATVMASYPVMEAAGKPFSQQYRIRHKNGNVRWIEAQVTPTVKNGRLVRIDGMVTDITARVEAELKLQASERRFRQIVETAQEGIWTIDEYEKTNFVNKRICDMLEYTPDEMMGKELYDFMDEDEKAYVIACMERRRNGARETLDIRYLTKTGRYVWANISANPIIDDTGRYRGALAMVTDITERKLHEELLQKSEANLRTIFDNTESSYILMDKELTVLSFNSVAQILTREIYKMQLREGANLLEYLPQHRKVVVEEVVKRVLAGENVKYEVDYSSITGGEKWLYMQWVLTGPLHDEKSGILFAIKDITEEKAVAEERERITADLIQRNKDLQHFAYVVSHNLRAPVANIMGLAVLLGDARNGAAVNNTLLDALDVSVKNLDGIIKDLNLVLQVRENVGESKEVIYFDRLVNEIKTSIANIVAEQAVTIHCDFDQVDRIVSIRSYLYSIFYNLILNSIKYCKAGVAPVITIQSTRFNNMILLTFTDNGKGIDLDRHGKDIFGLYKRFDTVVEGKGIGLFMVKVQVENLGGTVSVQSKPGDGATFLVSLPAD